MRIVHTFSEVDEQRINLTRFPLFFPEKRPFFLENAGTFRAGTPQAADLLFSRRIGISPEGNAVPIPGGLSRFVKRTREENPPDSSSEWPSTLCSAGVSIPG